MLSLVKKIRWPLLDLLLGSRSGLAGPPSKIIIGLGNPGPEYARTRHNVGFWCVDRIAQECSIPFSRRSRNAVIGEGGIEGHGIVLAKSRTFVNRSGEAATYLLARYRISPQDLLVICDDLNLAPGKIRLRPRGSAGGHNGIGSITEAIHTQDFPRLRVGIGQPPPGSDRIEYVLGAMSVEEQRKVDEAVSRTTEAVTCVLTEGLSEAMNRFN